MNTDKQKELTLKELTEVTGGSNPLLDAIKDAVVDAIADLFRYKGPQA